jgi:hypothetical protein
MSCPDCDVVFEGLPIQSWAFSDGRGTAEIPSAGPGVYRVVMAPLPPGNGFVRVHELDAPANIPDPAVPFTAEPAITLVGTWASGPNDSLSIASQVVFVLRRTTRLFFEIATANHCVIVERYATIPRNYPDAVRV